jgi:hypothetical protein
MRGQCNKDTTQCHDVFDPRHEDNRHAPGRRAWVWRRGAPIRCRAAFRFAGVDMILFPGGRQRATTGNAQAANVPRHGGVYASCHRARSADTFRPAGGARTAAGVRCGTTGLDRRSVDHRSPDLRLANTGTAASGIRLRRSDSPGRPVADRTRFSHSNLDEHRQISRGTRRLRR